MVSKETQRTIDSYDQRDWADRLVKLRGETKGTYWTEELELYKGLLPEGKVLEVGAGIGMCADSLRDSYDYVGTEPSEANIAVARERNPNELFLQQRIDELEFDSDSFDGFWASSVLLHIPREEIDLNLQVLTDVTRNNGIGFITMKEGETEELDGDRWFTKYSYEEFSEVLDGSGLTVLDESRKKYDQFANGNWLIYFVRVDK